MRKYETVVVFDSSLGEAQLKDEIKKVQTLLENQKAEEIQVNPWGRKEIAYHVKKQKYGSYVGFNFRASGSDVVDSISSILRISDNVLKFQTHRINERVRKFKGNPRKKAAEGQEGAAEAEY